MILGLLLAFGIGCAICGGRHHGCGCHHRPRPCYDCGFHSCRCEFHQHHHTHHCHDRHDHRRRERHR